MSESGRTPVLVAAARTPVGRFGGALGAMTAVELGATAIIPADYCRDPDSPLLFSGLEHQAAATLRTDGAAPIVTPYAAGRPRPILIPPGGRLRRHNYFFQDLP